MEPKTPEQLVNLLVMAGTVRAYVDVTRAAKRHRLDEKDIAEIERLVLIEIGKVRQASDEMPFDAEPAIRQAEAMLRQHFEGSKNARIASKVS